MIWNCDRGDILSRNITLKLAAPENLVSSLRILIIAFDEKENASLISFLRPVSFELVSLCAAMQNFSRLL